MIIDYHHHFLPLSIAERKGFREGQKGNLMEGGVPKLTVHPRLYDMEQQLREMDSVGVDISVLSCNLGWDGTLEDCREINNAGAELQRKYPARFVTLAHAPILEPGGLAEIERAVKELGMRGTTIASQMNGLCLDAKELWPFYKLMCDLDLAVFIHPVMRPQGYAFFGEFDLGRIIGREMDLQLQVSRVIAGRVMEEFPSLKLVFSHFGGGIAATKERLRAKSGRFGTLTKPFDESFDRLYFDMAGFEGGPIALRCAMLGIRPDRMVFATDYPQDFTGATTQSGKTFADIGHYIADVRSLGLGADATAAILGGTAAKLLHLA